MFRKAWLHYLCDDEDGREQYRRRGAFGMTTTRQGDVDPEPGKRRDEEPSSDVQNTSNFTGVRHHDKRAGTDDVFAFGCRTPSPVYPEWT